MSLLEKLKNLFTSSALSVSTKKQPVLPACIHLNEDPDLHWTVAEKIGDGAFGKIFKVYLVLIFVLCYCCMYVIAVQLLSS